MGEFWKNRVSELEVECVKKQHEIDKLSEENKQLKHDLKYKDGTKMFETLMENTEGEAKENLARHLYGNLKCVLWNEKMPDKDIR